MKRRPQAQLKMWKPEQQCKKRNEKATVAAGKNSVNAEPGATTASRNEKVTVAGRTIHKDQRNQ